MSKIELDPIVSGYNTQKLNDNFQKIEEEINNKMLSRFPQNEPNAMLSLLDMNSNPIINLPKPSSPTSPVRLQDIEIDFSKVVKDGELSLIRSTLEPLPLDGSFWFDKDKVLYVGDEGSWKNVSETIAPSIINVPEDFPTIHAAFLSIKNKRIPTDATCTIKVADGTYEFNSSLVLNHPDGLRLRVVGNESNEALCTLTIPVTATPSFDMIIVSNNHSLGYLNGFNIVFPTKATNWTGILAVNGAFIYCGNKIRVNNLYYGIAARVGSEVICDYAKVDNAGDVGIWAYVGSTVSCNYAVSNNAVDTVNNLGFGIQAEFGSSIECTGASASGCRVGGIASLSNSLVRAHNSAASNNLGSGFYASADGHIENHNSVASNNSRYGEERVLGGTIAGGNVTLSGNTLNSFSGYAYWDNSGPLGARIAANGNLRIDVNGGDNIYFNSSGGVQSQITHTPSSNSWPLQRASSANQPGVEAAGSATNIDFNVRAKGSGRVFAAAHQPNFVSFSGATSGGTPTVSVEGGDSSIDLLLKGKNGGVVRWGSHSEGSVTPNGFIQFKLEDGAIVKIPAERL